MKTNDIYLKCKEYLCTIRCIINHYEKCNRCMSIASLDNEMNEALNKIALVYTKVMPTVNNGTQGCDDAPFTDTSSRPCTTYVKNTTAFIHSFATSFESDDLTYSDTENTPIDMTKSYYLADIQFNIDRAQRVIDRMGTMIRGSQYINQQLLVN